MGDMVNGRYGTWEIWNVGDKYIGNIVHGRYGTWYIEDMIHG